MALTDDKNLSASGDSLDQELHVDNAKIKKVLGWQPRDMKEMELSMVESMIELNMI